MRPNGNAKRIPSILSSKPPCPGKIFPVSFNLAFRFKYEINKSPIWQIAEITIDVNKIISKSIKLIE